MGRDPATVTKVPRFRGDLRGAAGPARGVWKGLWEAFPAEMRGVAAEGIPGLAPGRGREEPRGGKTGGSRGCLAGRAEPQRRLAGPAHTGTLGPRRATSHPTSCGDQGIWDPEIEPALQIPSGSACSWGLIEHSGLSVSQKIAFLPWNEKVRVLPSGRGPSSSAGRWPRAARSWRVLERFPHH